MKSLRKQYVHLKRFNNNIRCIEIRQDAKHPDSADKFNNNIRCIEIRRKGTLRLYSRSLITT